MKERRQVAHDEEYCLSENVIDVQYCNTNDMIADLLTKLLNPKRMLKLTKMCGCRRYERDQVMYVRHYCSSGSVVCSEQDANRSHDLF